MIWPISPDQNPVRTEIYGQLQVIGTDPQYDHRPPPAPIHRLC